MIISVAQLTCPKTLKRNPSFLISKCHFFQLLWFRVCQKYLQKHCRNKSLDCASIFKIPFLTIFSMIIVCLDYINFSSITKIYIIYDLNVITHMPSCLLFVDALIIIIIKGNKWLWRFFPEKLYILFVYKGFFTEVRK